MNATARRRREAGLLGHMSRRIVETISKADEAARTEGATWYRLAHAQAGQILPQDVTIAAGVIAALSPRCRWEENLRRARVLIGAMQRGDAKPPVLHTRVLTNQAWNIAHGVAPLEVLQGPKVRSFYSNLLLDEEPVTVDVWAARIAEGRDNPNAPKGRRYDLIARAYREAAARLAMTPATCQATAWVQVRDLGYVY